MGGVAWALPSLGPGGGGGWAGRGGDSLAADTDIPCFRIGKAFPKPRPDPQPGQDALGGSAGGGGGRGHRWAARGVWTWQLRPLTAMPESKHPAYWARRPRAARTSRM